MSKLVINTVTVVGKKQPLTAEELARACGAQVEWVARLVEVGIVEVRGREPSEWRFYSLDLQRALHVRRLEQELGAGLDAAALILDLSQELRRLRSKLRMLGVSED